MEDHATLARHPAERTCDHERLHTLHYRRTAERSARLAKSFRAELEAAQDGTQQG
jgi:hypothetical protein